MESLSTYQGPPTMFKIYPVICQLNNKFQTLYLPNQKTATDEGLTLWKECLSVRQFLPLKALKFGIITFKLCESTTGYWWCFLLYTGKNTVLELSFITPETPITAAIVLKLPEPWLGHEHKLWMGSFKTVLN